MLCYHTGSRFGNDFADYNSIKWIISDRFKFERGDRLKAQSAAFKKNLNNYKFSLSELKKGLNQFEEDPAVTEQNSVELTHRKDAQLIYLVWEDRRSAVC